MLEISDLESRGTVPLCTIRVAKTTALISCANTSKLICAFVFVYMQNVGFLMVWLLYFVVYTRVYQIVVPFNSKRAKIFTKSFVKSHLKSIVGFTRIFFQKVQLVYGKPTKSRLF